MKKSAIPHVKIAFCLVAIGLSALFTSQSLYAQNSVRLDLSNKTANKIVTVAYIDYSNFIEKSHEGPYQGYGVDYLNKIAEYTGWTYKFVDMDWLTAYEAIKNGEIDFYCVARKTEDREPFFDFSMYPVCNEVMSLFVMPLSNYYYEDFSHYNGIRVGMLKNSNEIAFFKRYAKLHNFTFTLVEFPQNELAIRALHRNDVDAVALVNYSVGYGLQSLGNFGVAPSYMMSKEDSPLMKDFSIAQEQLFFDDRNYIETLENHYYKKIQKSKQFIFTRKETEYMNSIGTLTVAVSDDLGPLEYYDNTTNKFKGISISLCNKISELTGLKFKFEKRGNYQELSEKITDGSIQILGLTICDTSIEKILHVKQSLPYVEDFFTIVARDLSKLNSSSVVAVPTGFSVFSSVSQQKGYDNTKEFSTMDNCIRAVANHEADITFIVNMCETYLLNHVHYKMLQKSAIRDTDSKICLGISEYSSPLLLSIINKCIDVISEKELSEIVIACTAQAQPQMKIEDFLFKYGWILLLILFGITTLIVISKFRNQKEKQREKVLQATQKQRNLLQQIYQTIPCGIFQYAWEKPHRILNCNNTARHIYGYFDDDSISFIGKFPDFVVKENTLELFNQKFDLCAQSGKPVLFDWQIVRKDGSEANIECIMDVVETDDGKFFQEIFLDVTERVLHEQQLQKQYMMELKRSNQLKEGLLYFACFDIDEQLVVETTIDVPGVTAGITIDEFEKCIIPELRDQQTEEQLEELQKCFLPDQTRNAYESGKLEYGFTLCRRINGELQWLKSNLALRRNPTNGHLVCFDYIWDTTDDVISGKIVQNLALTDCDGYMSIDTRTNHCLQYKVMPDRSVKRFDATYGVNDSIHCMHDGICVKNEDDLNRVIELSVVIEQLKTEPFYHAYAILSDSDGVRKDKLINYFYLDKQLNLIAATVSDVTEIRRSEIRHAELLSNALATAEKAGAAKGEFLSRVSHEMRTPLNAVIGFLELAKDADSEQTKNYLASSNFAAKQLLSVINDVLDVSSIESGKMKIASTSFDFKHMLSSITSIYGAQCKQKNLLFDIKLKSVTEDWLVGDELRVNQILMNLLGNAFKFTAEGHITLTVSQTSVANDKIFIQFEIEDTGCGMSEEMKERLFKPFEQESSSTARKYGGSGLGLSIVKNLTSLMGGTVRVHSMQGVGTTFTVDLPFLRSDHKPQNIPKNTEHFRILVIDNESSELEYISQILEKIEIRCTCVSNADEAFLELDNATKDNDQYSFCLIDWCMPEMNTKELIKQIRKKNKENSLLIILSAYEFEKADINIKDVGADLFLPKPIFPSSLFDLFMSITDGTIATPKEEPTSWDFKGRRILLAEDNILNQIVVQGYLAKDNIVLDIAENGKVAVEMFTKSEPGYYDAILMDIQMPVMDGFETTKVIRTLNHPDAKKIPIIAQSADAFNEDIAKALSCGMNAHIAKPIKPDILGRILAKALKVF